MKKLFTTILGFILLFSTLSIGNSVQAATDKLEKVKFGTSIARTLDDYGMDYFQLSLKKSQSIKLDIKDAKQKKLEIMLVSGIDIDLFNKMLKEEVEDQDSTITDEELEKYINDLKIELVIDNLKGDNSIGVSKAEIGLKKGDYIVIVMSDSNLKKYGKNYNLLIKNSNNKNIEIESNDTFKTAMAIKRSKEYKASFFMFFDDKDYFKVKVPEAGQLVVKSTLKKKGKLHFNVYDAKKKKINTTFKKSGKTYTTQTSVKKGTYYIRVSSDESLLNYSVKAFVKTKTPKSVISNKRGTKQDTITLTGLQKGSKVIVYKDSKKKTILTSKTASSSKMVIKANYLNDRGGKVFVTVKNKALYTSSMKTINYKAIK